jgi:hypothetical protein
MQTMDGAAQGSARFRGRVTITVSSERHQVFAGCGQELSELTSQPPASTGNTLTSEFSARRPATTEPGPQTMKSYCGLKSELSLRWLR